MGWDASCVGLGVFSKLNQPVNLWTMPTLAGLEVSPGGFCAECRTVLGKAQAQRVEVSQGVYCPGFIQPKKETNGEREKEEPPALHEQPTLLANEALG